MGIKLKKYFRQWMVYWEKTGSDKFGQSKFAAPQPRRCRWEDGATMLVLPDQRIVTFQSHIMADQDILEGSLLILVPHAQLNGLTTKEEREAKSLEWVQKTLKIQYPAVPTVKEGAREIKFIRRTPDIKSRPFLFEVYLT